MKKMGISVGLAILVFAVAASAQMSPQPASGGVEQELIKLENGWNDALVKKDWKFIDRILADDFTSTDNDGMVSTKAQGMARLKSGEEVVISAVAEDFKVRVYGDVAVVFFLNTDKSQSKGKDTSGQFRITDTWVKRGGRWQCVAEHVSKIEQKVEFTLSEGIGTGKVFGIHTLSLKKGVEPREFEKFVVEEWAPVIQDLFPGMKIMVMKGERGSRINQYILAFDISSLYVRNFYIPRPWEDSEIAKKIVQDCGDKCKNLWDRFMQMTETSEWTDFVALVEK